MNTYSFKEFVGCFAAYLFYLYYYSFLYGVCVGGGRGVSQRWVTGWWLMDRLASALVLRSVFFLACGGIFRLIWTVFVDLNWV